MSSSSLLRVFLIGLAALTVCLSSTTAFAGEDEAKEFYSQAKEAYQAGDFAEAADLLERAYAEDPNLIYQYNRILALQGMEKYAEALRVLEIYENPMREDGRFDDVAEIRAQLEQSLAEEETADDAASGGEEAGDATAGDEDKSVDKQTTPPPTLDTSKRDRVIGWSLVGAGVASAAAGAPFYTRDPGELDDDQLSTYRTISIVTLSGAVVLSGVGAYFLYRGYSSESETAESARRDVLFTPYVSTDGGGGAVLLRF